MSPRAPRVQAPAVPITTTWAELDRPCTERAVAHALACAARRVAAHDDERAVLVHGDVHEWNALEARRPAGPKTTSMMPNERWCPDQVPDPAHGGGSLYT